MRPDIVIADYNLPGGLTGLQAVVRLRETLRREIPAIILTGDISTDTLAQDRQGGCLHLNKPANGEELTRLIRALLAETAPGARSEPLQPAASTAKATRRTIFLIDDDSTVRDAMRDLLQQWPDRSRPIPVAKPSSRPIVPAETRAWSSMR